MIDILVPTLGESVTEATVARWLKQVGEAVAQDEFVVELETDKVAVEVPAPAAGVLSDIAEFLLLLATALFFALTALLKERLHTLEREGQAGK